MWHKILINEARYFHTPFRKLLIPSSFAQRANRSPGTSPNDRNTTASENSPAPGSPVRLKATAGRTTLSRRPFWFICSSAISASHGQWAISQRFWWTRQSSRTASCTSLAIKAVRRCGSRPNACKPLPFRLPQHGPALARRLRAGSSSCRQPSGMTVRASRPR